MWTFQKQGQVNEKRKIIPLHSAAAARILGITGALYSEAGELRASPSASF